MMKKIKFAIVGCGSIGTRHLAVVDNEPRAEIVAVCDIDESKCCKFAEQYGDVPFYTDYERLLSETDADIISICTPHALHAPMSIMAAEARKHILSEKPMALTAEEARAMLKAAKQNGVELMVVKQNRYNVPIALTKQALDTGRLGRVFMVQCNIFWNRHDGYYAESDWRGRLLQEGGALYTQASHFIDLLIWWFGDVVHASCDIATKNHQIEIEDCGTAGLVFDSGVMVSLLWTTCVYNKNYEGSITIIAENGTVKIGGQYLNRIEYWDVKSYPLPENINFVDKPNIYSKYQGTSSNHDKVISDIVAKFLGEKNTVVKGSEAIRSIEAIQLMYENARKER
jgi:UDP-N-acetyl-2-amino-2-deoxyglucuronate dehydrogenase